MSRIVGELGDPADDPARRCDTSVVPTGAAHQAGRLGDGARLVQAAELGEHSGPLGDELRIGQLVRVVIEEPAGLVQGQQSIVGATAEHIGQRHPAMHCRQVLLRCMQGQVTGRVLGDRQADLGPAGPAHQHRHPAPGHLPTQFVAGFRVQVDRRGPGDLRDLKIIVVGTDETVQVGPARALQRSQLGWACRSSNSAATATASAIRSQCQ